MTTRICRPLFVAAFTLFLSVALPWAAVLAASQTVTIVDFGFSPQSATVNVGDNVTWRNTGGEAHTATSNNPGFDTGPLNPGGSKTITFGTVGTFDYHCAIHVSMRGSITVLAAVVTLPPPTPPLTAPPTVPPTIAPPSLTVAPTVAPTTAATPAPTIGAAATPPTSTTSPTPVPTAAPTNTPVLIAVASPSASAAPATAITAPTPAPAGDASPLPLAVGGVVLVGLAGLAYYGFRRR